MHLHEAALNEVLKIDSGIGLGLLQQLGGGRQFEHPVPKEVVEEK